MSKLLRRVSGRKERTPGALLTGTVGPEKEGGWSVVWAGEGAWPPRVYAPTLTEVVNQARSAAAALYRAWAARSWR